MRGTICIHKLILSFLPEQSGRMYVAVPCILQRVSIYGMCIERDYIVYIHFNRNQQMIIQESLILVWF